MAPNTISAEEQFHFLISCIKHSREGKVNFDEVAKECEIVSKGAAAKRYERLLKAHGIHPSCFPSKGKNAKENGDSDAAVTPTKRRAASTKGGTPKTPVKKTKKEVAIVSAEKIVEKAAQSSMIKDKEADEDVPAIEDADEEDSDQDVA